MTSKYWWKDGTFPAAGDSNILQRTLKGTNYFGFQIPTYISHKYDKYKVWAAGDSNILQRTLKGTNYFGFQIPTYISHKYDKYKVWAAGDSYILQRTLRGTNYFGFQIPIILWDISYLHSWHGDYRLKINFARVAIKV